MGDYYTFFEVKANLANTSWSRSHLSFKYLFLPRKVLDFNKLGEP